MCIAQLLHNVPDVIWSGIIASVLTLSGVLISNRSNTTRLKTQLTHDREEKVKERTLSLRREVYLKATEELVKLNAFLASLPQQDLAQGNLGEGFVGFQTASARLQLVAEPRTTLLAMQLSATYGELFFELMHHLMVLGEAKSDIKIADDLYIKANNDVQRILSAMTQHNETGKSDQQAFDALQRSFAFSQEQASTFAASRSAGWNSFNKGNIAFMRHLFSRVREIAPQQMKLMVEIRRDLSLIGDLSEVEEEMQRQLDRMTERLNHFLQSMESKIA
ncbi:hypothetical protein [Aquabacterium sp. CECT 9606]|uniref:hypothetical protein n=1 Tax=Aquabacterium sp. CECT 9606 TaxID=2845822 RepID=UPI001E5E9D27|nr:hypothetical protein [Aquabacterium sp. CECT 9606]